MHEYEELKRQKQENEERKAMFIKTLKRDYWAPGVVFIGMLVSTFIKLRKNRYTY